MKTVKIWLITLMFLLCIKGTHAQITPLPEDSAMWVYAINAESYYFIIKVKGDTMLNNVKYSKVYYALNDTSYSSTNEKLHCFIRNDSLKAYVRYPYAFNRDTSDVLLYDFGCKTGDTINLPYYHPINFDFEIYCDTVYKYIVFGAGHYLLNNSFYPDDSVAYYSVTPIDESYCDYHFSSFRSFIGSWDYLFYNEIEFCMNCTGIEAYNDLDTIANSSSKCFWYKGKWTSGFLCQLSNIQDYSAVSETLTVQPNPVIENSVIQIVAGKFISIEIYNILGTTVFNKEINETENIITIKRVDFEPGIYICRLKTKNNTYSSLKFVVY